VLKTKMPVWTGILGTKTAANALALCHSEEETTRNIPAGQYFLADLPRSCQIRTFLATAKRDNDLGRLVKMSCGFWFGISWEGQNGVMAGGVAAEYDFSFGRFADRQALGANWHAPIATGLDGSAHAPLIIPPWTRRSGSQAGTLLFAASGAVPDGFSVCSSAHAGRRSGVWQNRFQ
jgi:hypothetical protein